MNRETAVGASVEEASAGDDLQVVGQAIEQLIQNVTAQAKINDAIVGRLLNLERRVEEFASRSNGASVERQRREKMPEAATKPVSADNAPTGGSPMAGPPLDCLPMYLGQSTALCRVMKSFLMYVDTRDTFITPPLLLGGTWEPAETRLVMQRVKAGMTVVDVGANCGFYTLLMGAAVGPKGKVYAFEPDPRNLELLDRNLQVNEMMERVKVIARAALDRRATVELHQNTRNHGAHTLFVADPAHSPHPKLSVEAVPVDESVRGPVDFVKIEAEGSEPFILRGMRKIIQRSPHLQILMEFNQIALHNAGVQPADFLKDLTTAGFFIHSVTAQSTLAAVNDAALLGAPISTLLLSREKS